MILNFKVNIAFPAKAFFFYVLEIPSNIPSVQWPRNSLHCNLRKHTQTTTLDNNKKISSSIWCCKHSKHRQTEKGCKRAQTIKDVPSKFIEKGRIIFTLCRLYAPNKEKYEYIPIHSMHLTLHYIATAMSCTSLATSAILDALNAATRTGGRN